MRINLANTLLVSVWFCFLCIFFLFLFDALAYVRVGPFGARACVLMLLLLLPIVKQVAVSERAHAALRKMQARAHNISHTHTHTDSTYHNS